MSTRPGYDHVVATTADAENTYATEADTMATREAGRGDPETARVWALVADAHREQSVRYTALAARYAPG